MTDPTPHSASASDDVTEPDWATLARLAAREPATDAHALAQEAAAHAWLAAHPAEAARLRALEHACDGVASDAVREALTAPLPTVDVEAALARVRAAGAIGAPRLTVVRGGAPRPAPELPPPTTRRDVLMPRRVPIWRRAVGVLAASGVLAAGLAWWSSGGLAGRGLVSPPGLASGTPSAQRHVTGVGERQLLHLADGSSVVLGPTSTLDVPAGYGGMTRRVRLVGEGYFRAVHDVRRPFEVEAGDAIVHDIGTAFVVRATTPGTGGPTDPAVRATVDVLVTDGAVQLRPAAHTAAAATGRADRPTTDSAGILLRAGDHGRVVAAADPTATPRASLVARGTDVGEDTAWTTGHLVFRDAPLGEVAGALHRWYGVQLRFAQPGLAERHLTATFAGESTAAVLRVIALATGARLDRQGDTVTVYPTGREAAPSP